MTPLAPLRSASLTLGHQVLANEVERDRGHLDRCETRVVAHHPRVCLVVDAVSAARELLNDQVTPREERFRTGPKHGLRWERVLSCLRLVPGSPRCGSRIPVQADDPLTLKN